MIYIDRRIASAIRSLARDYRTDLFFRPFTGSPSIDVIDSEGRPLLSRRIPYSDDEIRLSLFRLKEKRFIDTKPIGGNFLIHMRPELLHRFAFFMDAFAKKFWCGFLAGIVSGIIIETTVLFIRWLSGI